MGLNTHERFTKAMSVREKGRSWRRLAELSRSNAGLTLSEGDGKGRLGGGVF